MPKAKMPDGRRKKDYPHKITVRLSDLQLQFLRELCGWLGSDQYVAYYLIICGLEERRIGPSEPLADRGLYRRKA